MIPLLPFTMMNYISYSLTSRILSSGLQCMVSFYFDIHLFSQCTWSLKFQRIVERGRGAKEADSASGPNEADINFHYHHRSSPARSGNLGTSCKLIYIYSCDEDHEYSSPWREDYCAFPEKIIPSLSASSIRIYNT